MLIDLWYQVTTDIETKYKGMTYDFKHKIARIDFQYNEFLITFTIRGEYFREINSDLDKAITFNEVTIIEVKITRLPQV